MRRLALVAGGTSGIGLGVAHALAPDYDLALAYASNHDRAAQAVATVRAAVPGADIRAFGVPLSGHADACELVARVRSAFARAPAALVNSTGGLADGFFLGSDFACH